MADAAREAWVTGLGIVSSLGEGPQAHWDALDAGRVVADGDKLAPYLVHPVAAIDFGTQIPRKDLRQMETWLRMGCYAAGLALDHAGLKGDPEILGAMDLLVATGTGERDFAVEERIFAELPASPNPQALVNERMMNDLRPRSFLAQLPNLLAGHISILHGVTGSSRTLMGEEAAGIDALRLAITQIGAGQSDIVLVGGSHNCERKDGLLTYEFGGFNWKETYAPVWQRAPHGGFALGSLAAFLTIEARAHAERRGARPLARIPFALSEHASREQGTITAALEGMWSRLASRVRAGHAAIVSGATGAEPATAEERAFLRAHASLPVRTPASFLGHGMEAHFLACVALAVAAVERGRLFSGYDPAGMEAPFADTLRQAVVTGVGHWRGEGMALVEEIG